MGISSWATPMPVLAAERIFHSGPAGEKLAIRFFDGCLMATPKMRHRKGWKHGFPT